MTIDAIREVAYVMSMGDEESSRRWFIAAVAGLSATGLSGCGSEEPETARPTDERTPTATPMDGVTPTEAPTDAPTEAPTEASTETPTDAPTDAPTETPTPTPSAGEFAEWPTYMYNDRNWGTHPDAVGPQGEVSVAWERDLGRQVNATAVLSDGTLYVGTGAPNREEGRLYGLDPLTGETTGTDWPVEFDAPVVGGPAVDENGFVYVAAGNERVSHRSDGSNRWRIEINPSPNYAPTTVADEYAYFAADSGRVSRLNALTSTGDWTYVVNGAMGSAPVVHDGMMYIGSRDGDVSAVTASGGSEEWVVEFSQPVNGLSMRDGRLYAALEANSVAQIDTAGRTRWQANLDSGAASTPAVAGDLVYVGLRDDAFVALDREEGLEQWRFDDVDDPFTASPVVVGATVYVANQGGGVYALDAESGELEWSFDTGGEVVDPAPVVAGRTVYIGNRSGTFYALSG